MPAPTGQEIRRKALELYYKVPAHVGLPPPEDVELKDRNMWREAQVELMRTWGVEVGESIRKGVETPPIATKEYLDYLKGELDKLEGMIREVKATPKRRRVGERIRTMRIIEQVGEKQEALSLLLEREPLLERAWAGDPLVLNWLEARGLTVNDLEAEVEYLRSVVADPPPQELILRNHTIENITALAAYVQSEGSITYTHVRRIWIPRVAVRMGIEEPIIYTGRLVSIPAKRYKYDTTEYEWAVSHGTASSLLNLIEPHLLGDKKEIAKYVLNVGVIPDTEYRPLYRTYIPEQRAIRAVFLHSEYVDFPVKYAIIIKKGEPLPRPIHPALPLKFTPEGRPIYYYEGIVR